MIAVFCVKHASVATWNEKKKMEAKKKRKKGKKNEK